MGDTTLKINFTYEAGKDGDLAERCAFWHSQNTIEWFEKRGYTLYKLQEEGRIPGPTVPKLPYVEGIYEGEYPYAAYDGRPEPIGSFVVPLRAVEERGKVVFAQDRQNRHAAIKLVRVDTDEHRILEFIRDQPLDTLEKNCVLPVLDILTIDDGFCFAVMPRWGSSIFLPRHGVIKDILHLMRDMLKGLAFLHQHNIIHGDIRAANFLEDDFQDNSFNTDYGYRTWRRCDDLVRYAIFDYDMSRKVPQEINRRDYWISTDCKFAWGSYNVTKDYAQGELEYNPFITDMGALGVLLWKKFQYVVPHLPILAPFFDMLTTHKLRQRFTASEALAFLEDFYSNLSEDELLKEVLQLDNETVPYRPYYNITRWAYVPPELAKKWAIYREPPLSLKTKLLRKLFSYEWLYYPKVFLVRRSLAKIPKVWRAVISLVSSFLGKQSRRL